jgi:hypothetical protein
MDKTLAQYRKDNKLKSLNVDIKESFFKQVDDYCKENMISKKKFLIDAINYYFKSLKK